MAKPTLRTNHILSLSIYIYTHLNWYICIRLCLYLYMCVFRWRNPHLEQITFCHYPLYIYTHLNLYICIRLCLHLYMRVFRWRNPHFKKSHFVVMHINKYLYIYIYISIYIYIYLFEPIYMYMFVSILVSGRILVAKPTLRTNHILSLSKYIIYIYIYTHLNLYIRIRLSLYSVYGVFRWRSPHLEQITFCRSPYLFF